MDVQLYHGTQHKKTIATSSSNYTEILAFMKQLDNISGFDHPTHQGNVWLAYSKGNTNSHV